MKISDTREGIVYENGRFQKEQRTVAREFCWNVYVNGLRMGSFTCSPINMQEAVLGYLRLNGRIFSREDVQSLKLLESTGEIHVRVENCAAIKAAKCAEQKICANQVFSLCTQLDSYRERSVHSCALVQGTDFVCRNDVSRGTAIDKAAGACLLQGIPTENSILVFSGRISSHILEKAKQLGCCTIIACSGPTDLACSLAEQAGITLVGLAGEGRFCIYTCPERIQ